ncbi:hypothetical protein BHE74_00035644, partial [Ensete ventricosum]
SAVRALAPPVYPADYLRRVDHVAGPAVRGCDDLAASWRKVEPRWQSDDLAATATEAALRLINEGWRATLLRHSSRTDNDRLYVSTLPSMSTEVKSRVRSATHLVCIKPPPEDRERRGL